MPSVKRLAQIPDVTEALRRCAGLPHAIFLDSARPTVAASGQPLGRYSFLAADPVQWISVVVDDSDPFAQVRGLLSKIPATRQPDLPPFQGGLAGLLSYELGRSFENLPKPETDLFEIPAISMGLYDVVLAIDHELPAAWIISQGWPESKPTARRWAADQRLAWFEGVLQTPLDKLPSLCLPDTENRITPERAVNIDGPPGLLSNFERDAYVRTVETAIEYIRAGDVFQINLAQQLLMPATDHAVSLYERLRDCNPAPFAAYFDLGPQQIVSASPERLVSVNDSKVETRPIKGTRRRSRIPEVDLLAGEDLLASEKDRAENLMIVDLMRNDLARVCTDASVEVSQLCQLEQYESVLHLVSAVQGELKPGVDTIDLLEAVFPGGSITGAPKFRAMEIICELERSARGAYCGSLGYIGPDDTADFNILIRTITVAGGWWQIPVGGGIVSQSSPVGEYEETWTKAAGMLEAVGNN